MRLKMLAISVSIILLSFPNAIASSFDNQESYISEIPDSHIIEGIPYIAQTEGYFCYYADITMILNHLGHDVSIEDILFYDGLGYIHSYDILDRLPHEGCYCNLSFVFDLFGLKSNTWYPNKNSEDYWNDYYNRVKENIINDKPVITRADPFSLTSLRNQFSIPDIIWNVLFPPGHHLILIVGFNESNNTICYNDPNAGLYGEDRYGNYSWMNINDFRNAVEINTWFPYLIQTFDQISQAYSKEKRFEKAIQSNILKQEGNYSKHWPFHGINGSKRMKIDYLQGESRTYTINLYKKYGETGLNYTFKEIMFKLFLKFLPNRPNPFHIFMVGEESPFESIAREKDHIANYLETNDIYQEFCENQSLLLRKESSLWHELSKSYNVFKRRGLNLLNIRANIIMDKMEKALENIISNEQDIINDFYNNWES